MSEQEKYLEHYLLEQKILSPEKLQKILRIRPELPLGKKIVAAKICSPEELQQILQKIASPTKQIGAYDVCEKIGEGAMGTVYRVRHRSLGKMYAMKILKPQNDFSWTERFLLETKVMAQLKHPNLVQVVDAGKEGDNCYYVMEILEGKTLQDLFQEGISWQKGIFYFKKILEALEYVHQSGILHRDLKPDNIFIVEEEPKITDFGLAKIMDTEFAKKMTQDNELLGTPLYMAPEILVGKVQKYSPQSDLYAVGVCLYQMITQHFPYEASSFLSLVYKVQREDFLLPTYYHKNIPRDLEAIVLKSLHKNTDKRYFTAKEFSEDLDALQKGYPVKARAISSIERLYKWGKRHKKSVFLATGTCVLSFFLFLYFWYQNRLVQSVHFEQAYQEARQKIAQTFPEKKEQLFQGLQVLRLLNTALYWDKNAFEAKQLRIQFLQQLFPIALELQEYSLAEYFLQFMVFELNIQEKNFFVKQLEEAKTKTDRDALQKVEAHFQQLKSEESSAFLLEEALFALKPLKSNAVQKRFQEMLRESTTYFLQPFASQTSPQSQYYQKIIRLIGRLKVQKLEAVFLQELQTMVKKRPQKESLEQREYMFLLAQSFYRFHPQKNKSRLEEICTQLESQSALARQIRLIYQ